MKKVSVVIPMYYEQEVAEVCYKRVKKVLDELKEKYEHEIIFINDGSKDKTLDILQDIAKVDKNVKIISFSRNFGKTPPKTLSHFKQVQKPRKISRFWTRIY